MKILYLVHDVFDPAVQKRIAMLHDGGATVTLAGFRREDRPRPGTIDFGRTHNGNFAQRITAVLREVTGLSRHRTLFQDADVILARSLEMLTIGAHGQALAAAKPVLVYEVLDIHRLLLKLAPLRWLEVLLVKKTSALITSSPAFIIEYFQKFLRVPLRVRLVENKVYTPIAFLRDFVPRQSGPPWRIGWFGAIRCRDSLALLCDLAQRSDGAIEIIIRGRPAYDQFDDFDAIVRAAPHVWFRGPYENPGDLAAIYRDVHFTWAIDRFEAGQNSSWLLPNRLYEGGLYNAVPIAETAVETGRFLDRLQTGITLNEPLIESLVTVFAGMTQDRYRVLEENAASIPVSTWAYDRADCETLVAFLEGLR